VLEEQNADLASKAGATQDELKALRAEKAKRIAELQVYKDLFGKLKALVDAGTIKVEFRKGRLVVKLASSILFDSGKTELKPEGQTALTNLATALKSLNDREFLVAGHTDNVPIKTAKFKTNWDLSTARAVEVVQFLITQGMTSEQHRRRRLRRVRPGRRQRLRGRARPRTAASRSSSCRCSATSPSSRRCSPAASPDARRPSTRGGLRV
jgi:flagellar motor protein MotB